MRRFLPTNPLAQAAVVTVGIGTLMWWPVFVATLVGIGCLYMSSTKSWAEQKRAIAAFWYADATAELSVTSHERTKLSTDELEAFSELSQHFFDTHHRPE